MGAVLHPDRDPGAIPARRLDGVIVANGPVSASMRRLDAELAEPVGFLPGQFCMLSLRDARATVFGRPFSILAGDGCRLSVLYKVVGDGTRRLAAAAPGSPVRLLSPLGRPFPAPDGTPHLLLAGGVGIPPLLAWAARWAGPRDVCCIGGRDGADLPWALIPDGWRVSLDAADGVPGDRAFHCGNVVELARSLRLDEGPRRVLACGPLPLLRAARALAAEMGWECLVSVEERMGCGYGVCRGCVVPRADDAGWRTACKDGPVFAAAELDWARLGLPPEAAWTEAGERACGRTEETR